MTSSTERRPPDPLVVDDLAKTYANGATALHGISFRVHDGEVFGLLGPNGAGKTTTLGILTTLVAPTGGSARVLRHDVRRQPREVRRSIGVVFQESVLDHDFSGAANLRLHADLWGVTDPDARVAELLAAVGLTDRASDRVSTYSGGMKRRLEIARALLARPGLLILDEPTLGLDPLVRAELWHLVRELQRDQHVTVLVSTHYLEEAQGVCDRVAIIDKGRLLRIDTPARLVAGLGRHILELTVGGDPAALVGALRHAGPGLGTPLVVGASVSVPSDLDAPELTEIAGHLSRSALGATTTVVRPATLNDVFLHLTMASDVTTEVAA